MDGVQVTKTQKHRNKKLLKRGERGCGGNSTFFWCVYLKETAFIKNQAPKCWCANRIIWLCIWHMVTLPAVIALERCLTSCGIAPCSCWTPGSMRNLDDSSSPWLCAPQVGFAELSALNVSRCEGGLEETFWLFANSWILLLFVIIHLHVSDDISCLCVSALLWLVGPFFQQIHLYDWGRF